MGKQRSIARSNTKRSPSNIFFPAMEGKVSGAIGILQTSCLYRQQKGRLPEIGPAFVLSHFVGNLLQKCDRGCIAVHLQVFGCDRECRNQNSQILPSERVEAQN
ncbi:MULTISPECIES: hypothetical protein [unclassified Microcoleus]|uniref:hypothetical protein n=2 Tax=unclassified Microcoleus TaxID=2642155 RepID=UPI001D5FC743|nr:MULTISPECIES: hypothetical protein [unclassified Microcoleus]MCC3491551.1 hypothetical protein [Microcoleus sp. PH2017_16_JOR_D_A]